MRTYRIESTYYKCRCGGTFQIDLKAQSLRIDPVFYTYVCDGCGWVKRMFCEEEMKASVNAYRTAGSNR